MPGILVRYKPSDSSVKAPEIFLTCSFSSCLNPNGASNLKILVALLPLPSISSANSTLRTSEFLVVTVV